MSPNVVTAPAQTTIEKMTRMIIQKGFRRMPVVQDGVLMGMVTASDIMKYLGSGEAFEKVVTGDIGEVMSQPIKSPDQEKLAYHREESGSGPGGQEDAGQRHWIIARYG